MGKRADASCAWVSGQRNPTDPSDDHHATGDDGPSRHPKSRVHSGQWRHQQHHARARFSSEPNFSSLLHCTQGTGVCPALYASTNGAITARSNSASEFRR